MPNPHPKEFRDDGVVVARKGDEPIAQIAKDFGISESCLRNWLHRADVEDGGRRPHKVGMSHAATANHGRGNADLSDAGGSAADPNWVTGSSAWYQSSTNLLGGGLTRQGWRCSQRSRQLRLRIYEV